MSMIHCPLFDAAAMSRHELAVVSGEHKLVFFELDEMATRVARNLRLLGVEPGARVAIFLDNSWQMIAILFGCWRAGVVAAPLNTRLPRAAVMAQVRHIAASVLIARMAQPLEEGPAAPRIVDPELLLIYRHAEDEESGGWPLRLNAPATILFTSGSSGAPKAAEHSVANHYYNARGSNQNLRLSSHDRWLLSLPLYHVGGLGILFRCALAGAAVALLDADEPIEAAQERYGATHLSLVSTQLQRLMQSELSAKSFSKVKGILLGGSAMPSALLVEAMRRHWPVYTSYGLTEMASQVCTMGPASPPAKRMTSGRVLKYREIRIDEAGEIWVRGHTLFGGYINEASRERAVDEHGWFPTGDLGSLDDEGYLTVHGRRDHLFISGGENIQPEEIENWLTSLPGVVEAIVVPRRDVEFGARPVAYIRWDRAPRSDADVRGALERILPRYKIPVAFEPWPDLGDGLKVDRRRLQALASG